MPVFTPNASFVCVLSIGSYTRLPDERYLALRLQICETVPQFQTFSFYFFGLTWPSLLSKVSLMPYVAYVCECHTNHTHILQRILLLSPKIALTECYWSFSVCMYWSWSECYDTDCLTRLMKKKKTVGLGPNSSQTTHLRIHLSTNNTADLKPSFSFV